MQNLPVQGKEARKVGELEFDVYGLEDSTKYADERKGERGRLYHARVASGELSGVNCEHLCDFSKADRSGQSGAMSYYAYSPAYRRLDEPVDVLILVDSCNAVWEETDRLVDELLDMAVFE